MKAFVSWSGEVAHEVAKVLRLWLPTVLQAVEPWVSSEDIGKGRRWSGEIERELQESRFGIICVTPANRESQWLNFEAGALAARVTEAIEERRVTPLLIGLDQGQLTGPLTQFQATLLVDADVRRLVHDLNRLLPSPVDPVILEPTLDHWVPRLIEDLAPHVEAAKAVPEEAPPARTSEDVQGELLGLVRDQARSIARLENRMDSSAFAATPRTADSGLIGEAMALLSIPLDRGTEGPERAELWVLGDPTSDDLAILSSLATLRRKSVRVRNASGKEWTFHP